MNLSIIKFMAFSLERHENARLSVNNSLFEWESRFKNLSSTFMESLDPEIEIKVQSSRNDV